MTTPDPIAVLIVEDERLVARDLQLALRDAGYDTFGIAASAEEAMRLARERRPDVVLMDIRIRGAQDGIEAARQLRDQLDVPVIFLTAHTDAATVERARRAEPYGYLAKPLKIAEVRSAIEVAHFKHTNELRVRREDRFYSQALHALGDAVVCTDDAGHVTFVNPAAEKLTGVSRLDAIGFPLEEVIRRGNGRGGDLTELIDANTGVARVVHQAKSEVVREGRRAGTVLVMRDVTKERLEQRQLEVAERLDALATMVAGVAHEVNNPLAVVTVNTTFAKEELKAHLDALTAAGVVLAPEALARTTDLTRLLSDIGDAAWTLAKVVSDLRTFTLPSRKTGCVANVARAAEWAARSTAQLVAQRAQLTVDVPADLHVAVEDHRVGQVLVNLLVNALQAATSDDPSANAIAVHAYAEGTQTVVIEVIDNGAGIPEELRERVFDPFFSTKPVGVGTGLGLSVVRGIVTSVGGSIALSSELGAGTTVRLRFPAGSPPS